MVVDEQIIDELLDSLNMLIEEEEMSAKVKNALEQVLEMINPELKIEDILKIQDELENISNMSNIDDFSRNELMNLIASIESSVNA